MRRLIINADDFGLTPGVNRAIAEANTSGIVTSATLMANSSAFDGAVALSQSSPKLRIGCHAVLVDGPPLCSDLKTLTGGAPRFRSDIKSFALAAVTGKLAPEEIQRETEAQIRKIQATGIVPTHLDTHKHTHMFPSVLYGVLRAAKACGVRAIRNPFEPLRCWASSRILATPTLWTRAFETGLLLAFAQSFRSQVREAGLKTTDGTVGLIATGTLDQKLLFSILRALPQGTWELVCHPGYNDADLQQAGTRLTVSRGIELEALTSSETRQALADGGLDLISYADL